MEDQAYKRDKESIRELAEETVNSNQKISKSLDASGKRLDGINDSLKSIASAVSAEVAEQIESFGKKQREVIETYQVIHSSDVIKMDIMEFDEEVTIQIDGTSIEYNFFIDKNLDQLIQELDENN